ncbi:MAG: CDP-alcohol phosphatidyltransferase family protein [Candidatus Freyarchaeota archaeon]|nr:CDP-alcohol phosphatidyltransferase family protein [Candidatus Jordarchaeia archaeon]
MSRYRVRRVFRPAVYWVASLCARIGLSPNQVTLASLVAAIIASLFLALGFPTVYGLLVFLSGFLDGVDGALARITGRATPQGGLLDSVSDRYSDVAVLVGFAFWREAENFNFLFPVRVWVAFAVAGFLMVSYIRARGEAAGVQLDVGFAARSERLLMLSVSSLLYPFFRQAPLLGLVLSCAASHATAAYRFAAGSVRVKKHRLLQL